MLPPPICPPLSCFQPDRPYSSLCHRISHQPALDSCLNPRCPQVAGLADELAGFNGTVFAPTNEAFAALVADMGVDTTTLTEETKQLLTAVLVRVAL